MNQRNVITESIRFTESDRDRVSKLKVNDRVAYPFIGGFLIITEITPSRIYAKSIKGITFEFFGADTATPGQRVNDFASSHASLYPYKKAHAAPPSMHDREKTVDFLRGLKVGDRAIYGGVKGFLVITSINDEIITARSLDNPSIEFMGVSTHNPGHRIGDGNYSMSLSPYRSYKSMRENADAQDGHTMQS